MWGWLGCLIPASLVAQVPSPAAFFGHELGSQFHRHHEVVDYVKAVAEASPRVQLQPYGSTYEGRPLMLALVSSEANLANLEAIRENNLRAAGLLDGPPTATRLPIVWLSYNIHGNESVSTEAAMKVLYQLATQDTAGWLDEVVVILDPCVNPDGRDRYVNWYRQVQHQTPIADPNDMEHQEPWPSGRFNHYLFDLNRDWCWQTQQESQQRGLQYARWMPQVHVDFHEMGPHSPYFFAPAARPFHPIITDWQRAFQQMVGKNHARYFDQAGWLYFTSEVYDLFYPSYGDTWPTYQGAIGFTYEQGGSGRAGLAYQLDTGDTLTLSDRLTHHYTTSLSTVETAYRQRAKLLSSYDQYFAEARAGLGATYQAYVVSQGNAPDQLTALRTLLQRQQIRYEQAQGSRRVRGHSYASRKDESIEVAAGDLIIPVAQPQGHLLRVLFDPEAKLEDSLTYDLTAWALPYAYGLKAAALYENVPTEAPTLTPFVPKRAPDAAAYAYLVPWEGLRAVRWMADMMQAGMTLRQTQGELVLRGHHFAPGTLVATRADNPGKALDATAIRLSNQQELDIFAAESGWAEQGADLGSETYPALSLPRVGLLRGEGVSATSLGAVWYCLEQEMAYPFHLLDMASLEDLDLAAYDVLILADGNYQSLRGALLGFIRQGGRVIALEGAIETFTSGPTALAEAMDAAGSETQRDTAGAKSPFWLQRYGQRARLQASHRVPGSVYEVALDSSHPLAYGLGDTYYALKHQSDVYPYLRGDGWNVGTYPQGAPLSGFAGHDAQAAVGRSLAIGVESLGRGEVVYLVDSPCFRAFWQGGKLLLANAIFFR
jgi:hypothetical protein